MWQWFMTNSVWILIVTGSVLTLLLFLRERFKEIIIRGAPEALKNKAQRRANVAFWTVEGIALAIVALSFTAITLSRTGVGALVTPQTIQKWFLEHGTSILIVLVFGIGLWYALKKFLPPLLRRSMTRPARGESREGMKRRMDTLLGVFMGLGRVLIILTVIFMVLSELDISIGPILAGLGIAGVAVGFGAQYLIRDLIAGIFIIMENQYRVGDVAQVADVWGLVEEISLRKTVLRDLDGAVHHVPNGEIRVASNYSRLYSRVNMNISVAYDTDLDYAISVVNRVCQRLAEEEEWGKLIKIVPQVLRVDKLGDSGIELKILGDVKPLEQWKVMGELRLRLKKAFDTEGIEIPWPHTKVYFGNEPGSKTKG